ncbi:MAG: hypothetical protein Q4C02_09705 [Eubacteriales bacterium]|nr:hypothetical protein [Eubacteriales bacterium]
MQKKVLIARQNSKWRREFMEWKMTLLNEREKGREEGALLQQIDIIIKKLQKGGGLPEVADAMEKDIEELRPIWEAVKAAAPEYDRDTILRAIRG